MRYYFSESDVRKEITMGLFDRKEDERILAGNTPVMPAASVDNGPGVMPISNVFGTMYNCMVTGSISEGRFTVGDDVTIHHANGSATDTAILAIEVGLMKKVDSVSKGEHATVQLDGIAKSAVQPGAVLRKR